MARRFACGGGGLVQLMRTWAVQCLEALFALQARGLACVNLKPRDLMVDACSGGGVILTYSCEWVGVVMPDAAAAVPADAYTAPEMRGPAGGEKRVADFWSLGKAHFCVSRKWMCSVETALC